MLKRETCLWILPVRFGVFLVSFLTSLVSAILIAATFLHRNPMMIHLAVIHHMLPWVYMIFLLITGAIGVFGMFATIIGSYSLMVLYKAAFWLMTFMIVYVWQVTIFVVALLCRQQTLAACNHANPQQDYNQSVQNANVTFDGYTATLLGLNTGDTYGLANCDQAVEAGIIGLAVLFFVGSLTMTWFALIVNKCARSLDSDTFNSRAKNARWNDNLDELQSAYARDKKNAPQYPLKDMKTNNNNNKFSRGILKLKLTH